MKGMRTKYILFTLFAGICLPSFAQQMVSEHQTKIIVTPRQATVNLMQIKDDYFPKLQYMEMPRPGIATEEDNAEMLAAKARIYPNPNAAQPAYKQSATLKYPVKVRDFEGNTYDGGVPDDNHIAISDSGRIVSVMNSSLNIYDTLGNLIKSASLDAFSQGLGLTEGKYDPKVLYDPDMDRFIAVCLAGQDDQHTFAIIAFSQTNNPIGNWNLYKINGNPFKDTTWSDFPIIAVGKNELFLTLNAVQDNKTWQAGFRQSYIWQIDKTSGYKGDSLITKLHSGIAYNGVNIRNICPIKGGSDLVGPQTWFVSDKDFSNKTDSIFLLNLSSTIADPNSKLTINLLHATSGTYGMAPDAFQPTATKVVRKLQTNDARVLDGFIENNSIQFVGNSVTSAGKAGALHGIISNVSTSPSVTIHILGDTLEYGYPSIAYAGINAGDDDALILVDHTSDTTYPGNSAFYYKAGNYSSGKRLFNGSSYTDISAPDERWGDYSEIQRKYNQPGKAWAAGYYGRSIGSGINKQPGNATRISEIQSPLLPKPLGISTARPMISNMSVFPVPAKIYTPLSVTFNNDAEQYYSFRIYDMQGKMITELLNDKVKEGKNMFSFSTYPLKPGTYTLSISSDHELVSKKFVVE